MLRAEHRHVDRLPDQRDRLRLLLVAEVGLEPHLDQRRVGGREQVGEPRLRLVDPPCLVEHDLWDELRIVDPRRARDARVQVQSRELLGLLLLLELPGRLRRRLRLLDAEVPGKREPVGGLLGIGLALLYVRDHRLDLEVYGSDGTVKERPRAVHDLHRLGPHQLPARAVFAAVGRGRPRLRRNERLKLLVGDDSLARQAGLEHRLGRQILGLDQVGQRLLDQDHNGVAAEVLVVLLRCLVARRRAADERVAPGRGLEPEREDSADERRREHNPDGHGRPSSRDPREPLEPLLHGCEAIGGCRGLRWSGPAFSPSSAGPATRRIGTDG